jgi:hypothetical protein
LLVCSSTGFRKDEIVGPFTSLKMSHASLFWIIGGVIVRQPSAQMLLNLSDDDYAGILVGAAKNDRFGISCNPHPIYMRHANDPTNAAAALKQLVLKYPIDPADARRTPLFFYNEDFEPFTAGLVDAAFEAVCLSSMAPQRFRVISWHSWRVTLACNLLAAGAPPNIIMALLRWKSEQMLLVYARWSAEAYSAWLQAASASSPTCVQGPNIPAPVVIADADPLEQTPGALQGHAYRYLSNVQRAAFRHPTAEQLNALAAQIPEIDGHDFAQAMPDALRPTPDDEAADDDEHVGANSLLTSNDAVDGGDEANAFEQ